MVRKRWPKGIRPWGDGIQIRIWRQGQEIYSETVEGNPYKQSDLAAAVKRREVLTSRLKLGLPLFENDKSFTVKSFYMVAQEYLSSLDIKYSTSLSYENIINRYWIPIFGDWLISDIKSKDIRNALNSFNVSQKTKNNAKIPLNGIFDFAIEDELIETNPARSVKNKKHQKPKVNRFLPDEKSRILSQLSGQPLGYFTLMFATGMRPGEILALRWSDWDGERFYIHKQTVRRKHVDTTKTIQARYVYVPRWARKAIFEQCRYSKDSREWLFLNAAGRRFLDSDNFNAAWKIALKNSGIEYRIPYTARHTRAAELLSQGVDPAKAAAELGHSTQMFFNTYSQWIEEYSRGEDLKKLEGLPPK